MTAKKVGDWVFENPGNYIASIILAVTAILLLFLGVLLVDQIFGAYIWLVVAGGPIVWAAGRMWKGLR